MRGPFVFLGLPTTERAMPEDEKKNDETTEDEGIAGLDQLEKGVAMAAGFFFSAQKSRGAGLIARGAGLIFDDTKVGDEYIDTDG